MRQSQLMSAGWLATPMLALAINTPASAAEDTDSVVLEAVVVTAQKRQESIQSVPISITALGSEQLEAMRVQGVEDYVYSIPNATFVNSGPFWGQTVSFRGISRISGKYEVVSVAVDDVSFGAISSNTILASHLVDFERIEVLRGPQGTLSGRNALGGSINLVTAQPNPNEYQLKLTGDFARFGTTLGKAVLNTPLSDTLAMRVSAYTEHSDGAIKNIGPAGGSSGYDYSGGRVAFRLLATDRLTLDASFGTEQRNRNFDNWTTGDFTDPAIQAANTAALASWGGTYLNQVDFFKDVGNNGANVKKDIGEFTRVEDTLASFKATYDLGEHQIQLIYGHFDYEVRYREDYDQTEYAWWMTDRRNETQTDSAELRFTSNYAGPINWVAGISYLDETFKTRAEDRIGAWAHTGGTPSYGGVDGGYVPAYIGLGYDQMQSLGFFANLSWNISDTLRLSAGGRYSIEDTKYASTNVFDIVNPPLVDPVMPATTDGEIKEFSPRVALNYDFAPDQTTYVQYSTGYRAGYGNDSRTVALGKPADVDPEYLVNYEIGYKGRLLDDRLTVSAAVFYMDYDDLQVPLTIPNGTEGNTSGFTLGYDMNAGSAHTQGFELETSALVSDGLRLDFGVGYTEAVIDQADINGVRYRDFDIPNVRPWTVKAAATYTTPFTNDLQATYRLDYTWQDELYWQGLLTNEGYFIDNFQTVDLSATLKANRHWSVSAYVTNALDEKYYESIGWVEVGFRGRMVYTPPRLFGLRVTYEIGGSK
ncbi:TonB-dependent receptor [Peristeroidobacter soli]|uniref:TonB-dependent receptor n=1 Tax=Peristeroidobacter soli TaxID=2497877 RepID=UPI00101CA9B2|nr:TonB-dependent receptor [Peristeroidobacter soli]